MGRPFRPDTRLVEQEGAGPQRSRRLQFGATVSISTETTTRVVPDTNSFAPLLERAGTRQSPSRIIIVSSTAGTTVPHVGEHGTIMYSISKAAAHHLSRQLAVELGPRNITTNTVAPGFFPSKLANGLIEMLGGQEELEENNPRKRLGEPEDIAGVMVFLCSPAGAYINGEDIAVDGGMRLASGRHSKL